MFFSGVGRQLISASPVLFLLITKYGLRGCNAVGCANTNEQRPTNTWSSFSAPEAALSEVEQRFDYERSHKAGEIVVDFFSSQIMHEFSGCAGDGKLTVSTREPHRGS